MPRRTHLDPRNIEVIDDRMAEIFRRKTGAEKLQIAESMYRYARSVVITRIQNDHPEWDEQAVRHEAARRMSRA